MPLHLQLSWLKSLSVFTYVSQVPFLRGLRAALLSVSRDLSWNRHPPGILVGLLFCLHGQHWMATGAPATALNLSEDGHGPAILS